MNKDPNLKKQYLKLTTDIHLLNTSQILSSAERILLNGMVAEPFLLQVVCGHSDPAHPSHLSTLRDNDGEFGFVVGSNWNILSGGKSPNKINTFSNYYLINMTQTIPTQLPVSEKPFKQLMSFFFINDFMD